MRKVHTSEMVTHLWANASQSEARNGTGSVFFDGDVIYSYGAHFPVARRINGGLFLFTTQEYSVTTSHHKTMIQRAIPNAAQVFEVDNVMADPSLQDVFDYTARINELFAKASRARQNETWLTASATREAAELNLFIDTFELKADHYQVDQAAIDKVLATNKEERAVNRKAKKEREAQRKEGITIAVKRWIDGEGYSIAYHARGDYPLLRLHRDGDNIETSHGAICPIFHAQILWRAVQRIKGLNRSENWYPVNTFRLGDFKLTCIMPNGDVIAGCHHIQYSELKRMAGFMSWNDQGYVMNAA